LALEWESIHGFLDEERQALMRLPFFHLFDGRSGDGQGTLAAWDNETRTIKFRRSFVLASDWGQIVNVLRHEMAHQLADAFYGAALETAHGPGFKKACQILQADPSATSHRWSDRQQSADGKHARDRLIRKVKLLMQLAESDNPNEAAQASAKANELILKHNLDRLNSHREQRYASGHLGTPALRHPTCNMLITSLLEQHYFVQVVWISAYVVEKGKMGRVPEVSGTPENLQIASYVYDYIRNYTESQWQKYRRETRAGGRGRSSFARGVVEGFLEKLNERKNDCLSAIRQSPNSHAVIQLEDPELQTYLQRRYNRLRSISRKTTCDTDIHAAGQSRGRSLVISRGLTERSAYNGLKLTE